jgi:hypothetical protein
MELVSGPGRLRLADHHDLIAACRAENRTLDEIADRLCVERNVLTTGAAVKVYCCRNRVPMGVPRRGPRRTLTSRQRAIVKSYPPGRLPYGVATMLAERFGVTPHTIWKERNRR